MRWIQFNLLKGFVLRKEWNENIKMSNTITQPKTLKQKKIDTTFNNGYLGSYTDEERSELR